MTFEQKYEARDARRYAAIREGRSDAHGDCYAMAFAGDGDYPVQGEELDKLADRMIERRAPAASVGDAPSDAVAWVMVPREATEEMWEAFATAGNGVYDEVTDHMRFDGDIGNFRFNYEAMLAASSAPPAAPVVSDAMVERALNRRAIAPWPDFAGNAIHDLDRIRHPDGTTGTVLYLPAMGAGGEAWRVVYEHGDIGRLALQIGDKGQAVVIERLSVPATDDKAPAVDAQPKCRTCSGHGFVERVTRIAEDECITEPMDCPVCDCAGAAPEHVQAHVAELNERIATLASRNLQLAAPTSPHDVDAVRGLVGKWRSEAKKLLGASTDWPQGSLNRAGLQAQAYGTERCADELEAAMSAALRKHGDSDNG